MEVLARFAILFITFQLAGCVGVFFERGFSQSTDEERVADISPLSKLGSYDLYTNCDIVTMRAMGPFIAVPIPIFPRISGNLHLAKVNKQKMNLFVIINDEVDVDSVSVKVNGTELTHFKEEVISNALDNKNYLVNNNNRWPDYEFESKGIDKVKYYGKKVITYPAPYICSKSDGLIVSVDSKKTKISSTHYISSD